jgi:aryl-alcohol dehydrogenase-like predicted oxidoreductase
MYATAEGTGRYEERLPVYRENAFFRSVYTVSISSLGAGTYLGRPDDATDHAYTDALIAAGENGINFFDTAINYRGGRSERCVGAALQRLQRDEIVVCTKAGFLTPGAVPASLQRDEIVGGMHSMAPGFLADQIDRSRANLGIDTIDVFYLHNPETQLGFVDQQTFEARILRAFQRLEQSVEEGKIRWYGTATWDGYRKGALSLPRMVELAARAGGPDHHFRWVQLPFNLAMVEAFVDKPESILQAAARLGIAVVASAPLLQTRVLQEMPDTIASAMPNLQTPAQRAIQFTRSTPGIAVAIVGMSRREHVLENLGVAAVPPLSPDGYLRLYQ